MRCHIHSFAVEFDGSNKMAQQWTSYLEGKKMQVVKVAFTRQLGDFSRSLVKGPINFCSLYMHRPIAPGRKASRLESSEPDAEKKRYGHQCQSHATEADHFF
jgi:hypothetical protein